MARPSAIIVYSPHYNIGFFGLEKLHPFDSRKYGRAWQLLRRECGRRLRDAWVRPRAPLSRQDLLAFHSFDYLRRLRSSSYLAEVLEVPQLRRVPRWLIDYCVLRPMRWAAAGTVIAAQEAMTCGLAINLAGGYHHASADRGGGFSVYADIPLAVERLRQTQALSGADRVAYIDLDAHQGNGVCHSFRSDSRVFIYDMYNAGIYPWWDAPAKERIDCGVPLQRGCDDASYLGLLQKKLPAFLDSIGRTGKVALAIFNAGTDVFDGDRLGRLKISSEGVLRRDLFVLRQLRSRGIPAVMLTSGGYTRDSFRLIARTVAHVMAGEAESVNEPFS